VRVAGGTANRNQDSLKISYVFAHDAKNTTPMRARKPT
jgi:hypothetical protein